ncbi:DUF115 domain-containing protein [Desulfofundulus thermobenzoicus]|uniref:DUF115 domain-containing protein n=1 Tax=Desulfofundulus thermobenzoicus TaxID=29376 RepID=A0A6N7IPE4_9FIRM|nr:6-hydroxymethylpterin diphosphokinase MptE-like protein [Desulfofundulus thermobenzoicus]MQL51459.1 DUF115 domain-containing protein [Desulfofundulus thermobenzoicus]
MKAKRKPHRDGWPQELYRANLKALSRHHPGLAGRLEKTPLTGRYRVIASGSGEAMVFNLEMTAGGVYYHPADPLADVHKQIAALKLKNNLLAVFLGFGLGYELLIYLQHFAAVLGTRYVAVIERDLEMFKTALFCNNLAPLFENQRISFFVGLEGEELYVALRRFLEEEQKFILLRAMKPVYHASALSLHRDYYLQALRTLREAAAHQVIHFGNDPKDSLIGIENMLENLPEILSNPGINLLYNRFKNRPAVVVATGPSLNKNKHLLKGLENRALIISVDASLKILMNMGVKPHLVTSLERVPEVVKLIDGFSPEEVRDVYLAACPVVRREVYQAYPGPRIIVYRNFDHFRWLDVDKGILNIGPSAGNMAFKVAEALGCNPIILIGQDLAFSREGDTHARGTPYGEKQQAFYGEENTLEVPGNDGRPIRTSRIWYQFLKHYELDVAAYNGTCVNCTEGGAYITGTKVMTFQEAIDRYMTAEFHPLEIIHSAIAGFSARDSQRDADRVATIIEDTRRAMQRVVEECLQGLQKLAEHEPFLQEILAGEEVVKKRPSTEKQSGDRIDYKDRLAEIDREIMAHKNNCINGHPSFQLFFAHIFQSYMIKFEMEMCAVPEKHDSPEAARAEILLYHRDWFTTTGGLAGICVGLLERAGERLEQAL